MNKIILSTVILVCSIHLCYPNGKDPCQCTPTTKVGRQHRTIAKHEIHFENYSKAKYDIAPDDIIGWQKKYKTTTSGIKKDDIRWNFTPEDSLYTLKGWMYFVKQEANDCDLHIEIGPENIQSKSRVIVEITNDNCDLQRKVYEYITSQGFKLNEQFNYGLAVTISGLGFYDEAHKPAKHGGIHTHKTSWELHPVKDFKFD